MLLHLPVINRVDALVIGVDAQGAQIALSRCRAGASVLATCSDVCSSTLGSQLQDTGVDVLNGMIPVAPLGEVPGWAFLSDDGYVAIRTNEVVGVPTVATTTAPVALPPGEELIWCYDNPRYVNGFEHISIDVPPPSREMTVDVLVVGDGCSGMAAANAAVRAGCRVLCIGGFACLDVDGTQNLAGEVEYWRDARLGGVLRCRRQITGILCTDLSNKSYLIHSKVVIDATGNAFVVHTAGGAVSQLFPDGNADHSSWGTSLGYVQLPGYVKELLWCENDATHPTEAMRGRDAGCRIVGEMVVQPQDIVLARRYWDTVGVSHGVFEDAGSGIHSILSRLMP
ncbi:MAG: hypothetical protein IKR13_01080, partial [Victivallales bacterium]|nr:hypothetical protein [Victivallales bacterium]